MKRNRIVKNAAWIIGLEISKMLISLVISMLTARYLGPSNFGLINYASSIVAFVAPIMYLGLNSTLVQEIVSKPEREGETIGTAVVMSLCSSFLCILGVISFAAIANHGEKDTIIVCALYSVLLVFQSVDLIQYYFQAKLLSKYSSLASFGAYLAVSAYKIYLLATNKSIYWFAVSNALDYMIIAAVLLIIYKRINKGSRLSFSFTAAKRMFAKSKFYIVSSLMVAIFAQTDKIMLKMMINEEATGYYSAAVACAGITGFVFSAMINSFRPVIFESKNLDDKQFQSNMIRLYSLIIYISLAQCIVMTVFSKWIILLLYGEKYIPAISALRIAVWYTTFSYLGSVRNIWILAENKQHYLWIINLSGALANILLNYILIPILNINGAALASLLTQIFTNVIIGFLIKPIRPNNKLMLLALNPKGLFQDLKKTVYSKLRIGGK